MNTLDINTIAFEHLLRTNTQNNNGEEIVETLKYNPEQYIKGEKSLLLQMYALEEEDQYQ